MAKRKMSRRKGALAVKKSRTYGSSGAKVREYAEKFPGAFAKKSAQYIADKLNVSSATVYAVRKELSAKVEDLGFKEKMEGVKCPTDFGPFEKVEQSEDQLLENVCNAMAPVPKQAQQIIVRLASTDPIDVVIENMVGTPICVMSINDVGRVHIQGLTARSS